MDGTFHERESVEQGLESLLVKKASLLVQHAVSGLCRKTTIEWSCIVALVVQSWAHASNQG